VFLLAEWRATRAYRPLARLFRLGEEEVEALFSDMSTEHSHKVMAAVHDGDRAAFEAAIDRDALRSDLRDQLADMAREKGVLIDGGPSEFTLDRMISPNAFRLVAADTGKPLSKPPGAAEIAAMMEVRDRAHVCVGDRVKGHCELAFAKREGVWRLVGMRATNHRIEVPPAPTK
jgi:hypothetical protein